MKSDLIKVFAPTNIALIKYMGKQPQNIPENPSLSLTLQTLGTLVTVGESSEPLPESPFKWIPYSFVPGSVAQQKMRKHFERVAHGLQLQPPKYDVETQLRSYNNFPSDAGIASSASSFAALTLVFARLCFRATNEDAQLGDERFLKLWNDERIEGQHLRQTLSRLSREGSGSSIRSWSGPWVEWSDQDFKKVSPEFPQLIDHIVIVSDQIKAVGSSEAHQRVKTSPFWSGRPLRAQGRYVAPRLGLAGLVSTGDTTLSFVGEGLDPVAEQPLRHTTQVFRGDFLSSEAPYEVIMGKGLAKSMGISLGASLVLMTNTRRGAINASDVTLRGIFGTADKSFDDHVIRMPLVLA
jgi:mevalonate pyrophosphate decarboxylase